MASGLLGNIKAFIDARIRTRPTRIDEEQLKRLSADKAVLALQIIESPIFIEVYQDELAAIVDRLLSLDMAESSHREHALNLLARAQALQQLSRRLGGLVASNEILQARNKRAA